MFPAPVAWRARCLLLTQVILLLTQCMLPRIKCGQLFRVIAKFNKLQCTKQLSTAQHLWCTAGAIVDNADSASAEN